MASKGLDRSKIIKLVISTFLFIGMGFMIYDNFIKKEKFFYAPPVQVDKEEIYEKFNLDFLESERFKGLIKIKDLSPALSSEIGRENPFIKF